MCTQNSFVATVIKLIKMIASTIQMFLQILESDRSRTPIKISRPYRSPGRVIEMDFIANNSWGENSFAVEYRAGKAYFTELTWINVFLRI